MKPFICLGPRDSFLDFLLAGPAFDNQSYKIHSRFHQPIHMGQIFGYEGRIHEGGTEALHRGWWKTGHSIIHVWDGSKSANVRVNSRDFRFPQQT